MSESLNSILLYYNRAKHQILQREIREIEWNCCVGTYDEFDDRWVAEILEPLESITIFCLYRRTGKLKIK